MGLKSTSPKPGPFRFRSFAWKWAKCGHDSRMICGMGFDSEHIAFTSRMILKRGDGTCCDELKGFGGGIDEVRLRRRQGLEANGHLPLLRLRDRGAECRRRPVPRLLAGNARQHVALLRRADDHHLAAEVGAEVHQVAEILRRALAEAAVRVIDVEPLGLHQHPVDAGDGYPVPRRRLAHGPALACGNIRHRIRQGERGDLHAGIAEPCRASQGVFQLPALEDLVANGEFHPRQTRVCAFTVQD